MRIIFRDKLNELFSDKPIIIKNASGINDDSRGTEHDEYLLEYGKTIFDKNGKLLGKFMAYDKTVKTGVKVVAEDINKDGTDEILASVISF